MDSASPFAHAPASAEAVIARVRDDLTRECGLAATCPPAGEIERLAQGAVRELWGRPVKIFVHVLALRQAREALGSDRGPSAVPDVERRPALPVPPGRGRDELLLDRRDVLTLSDDVSV
ncbi:MAG: hypothetical protein M3Q10_18890 [Chloroflexota bacterium]|nr:hypothetical protein [Chloroflexota bacterium]